MCISSRGVHEPSLSSSCQVFTFKIHINLWPKPRFGPFKIFSMTQPNPKIKFCGLGQTWSYPNNLKKKTH